MISGKDENDGERVEPEHVGEDEGGGSALQTRCFLYV